MSTQLVRLAAAVLTSEKGRKTVGWVLAAILSPVILLVAFLCCVGSGTAEHNGAVVSAAFYGTELSESVPTEYRAQLTQMRGSFAHLDAAVAEVNQKAEGNSLDPIQVKAVFFVLCFGDDILSRTDAEAFVACFYETETRVREETDETYEVAVPLPMEEVYAQLSVWRGRAITTEERSNAMKIYSMVMGSAGSGTFNGAYEPGGNAPMELEASMFTDPATKNGADLAIYAANAWNSGWGYVWGTFGQVLTPELLQYKISQYPEGVGDEADFIRSHWLNRRTTDCVGLIKGYGWLNTETMEIQYGSNGMPDVGADGMYYNAGRKGSIETIQTAKALLLERIRALETGAADDPGLVKELQELSQALAQVGGKHVYSYLPKSVKAQVDAIVERLAQLPEVAACYDQWWQLKDEIAGYYGRNTPPRQPLTQRKEFRSLKNWIIREAENISFSMSADSVEPGEKQSTEKTPPIRGSVDVQPVGEAVSARHIPTNAVMRLLHHMGQIFRTSMPVIPPALRIDSKRRRRLQEKRMALGHKRDDHEDERLHHVNDNTM